MNSTPNVIKAVADHTAKDLGIADGELDQMATEFAAACLQFGELTGLDKFRRAVEKARAQRLEKGNGKDTAGGADTPPAGEAAAHGPRAASGK